MHLLLRFGLHLRMVNWRLDGAIRGEWRVERHHRLGRAGKVMWQAMTSKVVAHVCVD
jgi:hypothetical protein